MPKIFVLPTQADVVRFQSGKKPENVLKREFATEAEVAAYQQGMEVLEAEFDELDRLEVAGTKVWFTRATDGDDEAEVEELDFATPEEALACRQGIDDSDGFKRPLVIEASDAEFDVLAAMLVA